MKRLQVLLATLLCAWTLAGCSSVEENAAVNSSDVYYTGSGGKGMSLTVYAPEGKGLSEGDAYLPDLVQSVISGDFTRYSAMDVTNWAELLKVLKETESLVYAEGGNVVEVGKITKTQFIMTGSLTKTGGNFAMQLAVSDTKTGTARASYTKNCAASELVDMSAIRKASVELLQQMGVNLNAEAKEELSGAASQKEAQAQTAIAKGAQAQKSGTVIEAMSYYFEAASFDPSLLAATDRLASVSATISTGNIGENVRTDIQRYNQWKNIVEQAYAFYQKHPPIEIFCIGAVQEVSGSPPL
jgi:hypothetical protein